MALLVAIVSGISELSMQNGQHTSHPGTRESILVSCQEDTRERVCLNKCVSMQGNVREASLDFPSEILPERGKPWPDGTEAAHKKSRRLLPRLPWVRDCFASLLCFLLRRFVPHCCLRVLMRTSGVSSSPHRLLSAIAPASAHTS